MNITIWLYRPDAVRDAVVHFYPDKMLTINQTALCPDKRESRETVTLITLILWETFVSLINFGRPQKLPQPPSHCQTSKGQARGQLMPQTASLPLLTPHHVTIPGTALKAVIIPSRLLEHFLCDVILQTARVVALSAPTPSTQVLIKCRTFLDISWKTNALLSRGEAAWNKAPSGLVRQLA